MSKKLSPVSSGMTDTNYESLAGKNHTSADVIEIDDYATPGSGKAYVEHVVNNTKSEDVRQAAQSALDTLAYQGEQRSKSERALPDISGIVGSSKDNSMQMD